VGRVTGLLGTYLALWQLLLMARLPRLERCFGLERMTVLHRWNGYLVLGLLMGHGVFQTLGDQLGDGKSGPASWLTSSADTKACLEQSWRWACSSPW
jgi:predicted ferric reductase